MIVRVCQVDLFRDYPLIAYTTGKYVKEKK